MFTWEIKWIERPSNIDPPEIQYKGKERERDCRKKIMETRAVLTQYARTKLENSRRCFFIPIVMYSTAKMDTGSGKRGLA